MICKITLIFLLIVFCALIDGNTLFQDDDENDFELSNPEKEMFLRAMTNDEDDFVDKRQSGRNCVSCGWLGRSCCSPNVCVKHLLRNRCMQIKGR